jgi:hypothetical protein
VWQDDRDMNNPANTVSLLNSAGFSAAMAALVDNDINMAKCQQGECIYMWGSMLGLYSTSLLDLLCPGCSVQQACFAQWHAVVLDRVPVDSLDQVD